MEAAMTCDAVRERFSDLMDGELDEALHPRIEEHLKACGSCRLEWAKFRQTVDAVRGMPQLSAPKGFTDEIRQRLERAELLDREEVAKPSRMGWKRPLMLLSAAAAVLLVARVGLESRNKTLAPPESSLWKAQVEDPSEALRGEGGSREGQAEAIAPEPVPVESPEALPPIPETQVVETREPAQTAPEEGQVDLADAARPAATPPAPAAPPPDAAPGSPLPPRVIALAWVMPCADAEAGARSIRDAFASESREPVEKPWLESRQRGRAAGRAPQLLTLRVRASELEETTRRLEALGARPAPAGDEIQPSPQPELGLLPKDAETKTAAVRGDDAHRARAAEVPEMGKVETFGMAAASDLKKLEEVAKDLPAPEAWVILTVRLEPVPEARSEGDRP